MGGPDEARLSPTPHYDAVRERAAEIARGRGGEPVAAEHLLLAMVRDGGWPVAVLTDAGIIDAGEAEGAVIAGMSAPGYAPVAALPLVGGQTADALGDSYLGLEHALLEIIGDRDGGPARALAGVADLDAVEAAVLAAKNAPPRTPDDAAFLPDGRELDAELLTALAACVPAGASFGFNHLDGRTYIHVWGDGVDRGASRAVLDAAVTQTRPPRPG